MAAAAADDEVFILTNLDFATGIEISKEVTINLNGKTLTIKEDTEGNGVFHVVAGGKLIINGEGTVNGKGNNSYNIAIWADGGEVIINNGTFTNIGAEGDDPSHFDLIYVKNNGKVIINGGTFSCATPKWTLNKNDKIGGTIEVRGGTFIEYNPEYSETESSVESFVAKGYVSIPGKIEGVNVYKVVSFDSI